MASQLHHLPTQSKINAMATGGLTMDQTFVLAPEHRPMPIVSNATGIPLIDLSPITADGGGGDVDTLSIEVGAACRAWGFFVAVGHGVPWETVERAAKAERTFFALPPERKVAVRRSEAQPLGYYELEHTKNVRDWKEVYDLVPREPPPPAAVADGELVLKHEWPQDLPGFREVMEEYGKAMEQLAFKLLELIARSLKLRPDRLHGFFKDQTTYIRMNHYPACPSPDLALGVGRHKDSSALTILYQDDVGGLDVRQRSDGEWVRVKPVPNSFVINIGDIVQVWSNDRYESMEHRVSVNSARERLSMAYFLNTAAYTMVEPLEELVSEDDLPTYKPYNWGDFFKARKNGNFKKLNVENIQVANFKKSLDLA